MKYTVCIVTGTRAEFGLIKPLAQRLMAEDTVCLQLVVTGSHLIAAFGNTQAEIEASGIPIYARIPVPLEGDEKVDMGIATGETVSAFSRYFGGNRPDLLVVLGDRFEIFAAAVAAALQGIPIAHLHGGETTEGAADEFLRHSITKMSYLHFTACEAYRQRVIQLGEAPERVFNVGALGVENIVHLPERSLNDLSASLQIELKDKQYSIVTFHPVTQEENTAKTQVLALIGAMKRFPDMRYIITKANADAGGRIINAIWDEEAAGHDNWRVVASLGSARYLSALKHACMMIGNSSSGIVEAPAMRVPTINIGDRQRGRMMADSVISCTPTEEGIEAAMRRAMTPAFQRIAALTVSPFGDGNTSGKIVGEILRFLSSNTKALKKSFYDVAFEVN